MKRLIIKNNMNQDSKNLIILLAILGFLFILSAFGNSIII